MLIFSFPKNSFAQKEKAVQKLNDNLLKIKQKHELLGLSVAVVRKNIAVFLGSYGLAHERKKNAFSDRKPTEAFEYSNLGYGLIGALVEKLSKQRFDKYCKTKIFQPTAQVVQQVFESSDLIANSFCVESPLLLFFQGLYIPFM